MKTIYANSIIDALAILANTDQKSVSNTVPKKELDKFIAHHDTLTCSPNRKLFG